MAAPAVASAQSGGAGGGSMYVATPKVAKVTCLRKCASKHRARGGSVLKVAGTELAGVNQLTYLGSYGSGDDVAVQGARRQRHPPPGARAARRGDRPDPADDGRRRPLSARPSPC